MKRLFWIGVGAAATVVVLRKARAVVEAHTPSGVAQAASVVTGLSGALRTARAEFSAGLAEREAALRHDLLGDVDLDEARTRADAWRAQRSSSGSKGRGKHSDPDAEGKPQAQDPSDDDGDLGYSFF